MNALAASIDLEYKFGVGSNIASLVSLKNNGILTSIGCSEYGGRVISFVKSTGK